MASGCDLVGNSMVDYFLDNTGTVSVTGVVGKTLSVKMSDETILIPPGEPSTIGVTLSNPRNFDIRYEIAGAPAGKDVAARQTKSNEIEVDIGGAAENDEYNLTLALQSSDGLRNFLPYTLRLKCMSFETGLFDFKVNGATPPAFDPNGGFTANVPYRKESAILQGIAVDPNAVVEIFSGSGGAALATGTHTVEIERALEEENNYFYIRITAPSSLTQGYVITVYRGKNSDNDITDFYFDIGGKKYGVEIGEETHAIAVTVPYGTDITRMRAQAIHTGDSISPLDDPEAERSYAAPVTYTVTAANGATQEYTVTATVAKIASIGAVSGNLAFARTGSDISGGTIKAAITAAAGTDAIGTAIVLDPADYSVAPLAPSSTGTTVSATLRVPADKSSTGAEIAQEFEVYIKSDAKEITDFYFEIGGKKYGIGAGTQSGSGTISGAAVTVAVPYGTDLSGLSPTVALGHSGASITPPAGTAWGSPADSKTYTVTAEDGATQDYTVTASVVKIASIGAVSENLAFAKTGSDISGDIKAAITPVTGTDGIGTAITLDPADYSVAPLAPSSTGTTVSATLRVPVDKSSTGAEIAQEFEVYIKSDDKEIKDFYFEIGGEKYGIGAGTQNGSGTINGTDITITLPYGTDISGLPPTVALSHSGASITSPAGMAWNSPAGSKTYTVTAEDGATQEYTVTVVIEPGIAGGIVDPSIPIITFDDVPLSVTEEGEITITINGETVNDWYIDINGKIEISNSTANAATFKAPATSGFYNVNVIATVDGIDYAGSFTLKIN
jgi:hypothetical protein